MKKQKHRKLNYFKNRCGLSFFLMVSISLFQLPSFQNTPFYLKLLSPLSMLLYPIPLSKTHPGAYYSPQSISRLIKVTEDEVKELIYLFVEMR